jgi:uncharacterized membrane protein YgdD (TMEM256/DUF423 family)
MKESKQATWLIALGAANAALAVALGAASMHAWREMLIANDPAGWFNVALDYHRYNALGLVLAGLAAHRFSTVRWFPLAGWLLLAGILIFSGNLYLRSLAGVHTFHAVTPFGGGAFIIGWLIFAIGAVRVPVR